MRYLRTAVLAVPLLVVLSPVSVCAASTSTSLKTKHPEAHSDAQIEATLRAKLAKSKIGKDGFRFHVQHGIVTWEGTTKVPQHKGAATRMAKAAGAVKVVNNIEVEPQPRGQLKRAYVVRQ